mmetsp:Transcript_17198/g.19179  ORF Transcript_17198/g.19179 Transcript_17198/m.19179 type:complete len:382 (+) Transcript_17198:130-1275(+)
MAALREQWRVSKHSRLSTSIDDIVNKRKAAKSNKNNPSYMKKNLQRLGDQRRITKDDEIPLVPKPKKKTNSVVPNTEPYLVCAVCEVPLVPARLLAILAHKGGHVIIEENNPKAKKEYMQEYFGVSVMHGRKDNELTCAKCRNYIGSVTKLDKKYILFKPERVNILKSDGKFSDVSGYMGVTASITWHEHKVHAQKVKKKLSLSGHRKVYDPKPRPYIAEGKSISLKIVGYERIGAENSRRKLSKSLPSKAKLGLQNAYSSVDSTVQNTAKTRVFLLDSKGVHFCMPQLGQVLRELLDVDRISYALFDDFKRSQPRKIYATCIKGQLYVNECDLVAWCNGMGSKSSRYKVTGSIGRRTTWIRKMTPDEKRLARLDNIMRLI